MWRLAARPRPASPFKRPCPPAAIQQPHHRRRPATASVRSLRRCRLEAAKPAGRPTADTLYIYPATYLPPLPRDPTVPPMPPAPTPTLRSADESRRSSRASSTWRAWPPGPARAVVLTRVASSATRRRGGYETQAFRNRRQGAPLHSHGVAESGRLPAFGCFRTGPQMANRRARFCRVELRSMCARIRYLWAPVSNRYPQRSRP